MTKKMKMILAGALLIIFVVGATCADAAEHLWICRACGGFVVTQHSSIDNPPEPDQETLVECKKTWSGRHDYELKKTTVDENDDNVILI